MAFVENDSPEYLYFEVTNRCNARCIMCPREKQTRAFGNMSFADFQTILNEVKPLPIRYISLTGYGEPLLDKDLPAKIRYAKKLGFPFVMVNTNVSLLKGSLIGEILHSGLDLLSISFYGRDKEEYEQVMKGLKFENSLENIISYLRERKRSGVNGPRVQARALGWFGLVFLFDWRFKTHFALRWLKTYLAFRARLVGPIRSTWHNFGGGRSYRTVDVNAKDRRCGFIETKTLTILWNGDVVKCCRDFDAKMIFGNALREGVAEVWNQPRYRAFREALHRGESRAYPSCHECDDFRPVVKKRSLLDWKKSLLIMDFTKQVRLQRGRRRFSSTLP